ncbi:hypothetical protein ASPCAL01810 [Aspergillus calidoustus]|uniref:Zn(2)-C6 fungal-type domain-containing protein n=1 Tax=Aspergillus calidoustus TaxID=454130 RepID=A0A0U5GLW2_ASPCI|nr:hypothetical protein ASPCAL01810 [Aspergillus calidoustus]
MNSRKRLRTSYACDICRVRKIRCDGRTPCGSCQTSAQGCTYGVEASSRGKTDIILERVEHVEALLNNLNAKFDSSVSALLSSQGSTPPVALNGTWSHISPSHDSTQSIDNAVLRFHTSATESILQWPYLASFTSLKDEYMPISQLEQSRPPFRHKMRISYPRLNRDEVTTVLDVFSQTVNFVFPTVSVDRVTRCLSSIVDASVMQDDNTDACLSLLMIALGCASQTVSRLRNTDFTVEDKTWCASRRVLGDHFFDLAMMRVPSAHTDTTGTAVHCLFFVGLYFCYLRRPFQAWEYINAASAKCLLLLTYPNPVSSDESIEHLRRIFWACYIIESDYIAELSALPTSGIAPVESQVPLPGNYRTHQIPHDQEQASLYFLACISIRRLLNRVHQLLYDNTDGVASHPERFPQVAAELDQQLSAWREVLPPSVSFPLDNPNTENSNVTDAAGFLRLRFLGCRSVIYRPYLTLVLSGEGVDPATGEISYAAWEGSKNCIESLSLLVQALDGFPHQVLIDTWQSSLSYTCSMLILLAAANNPALRPLITEEVLGAGKRLVSLYQKWEGATGGPGSPTVEQNIRLMGDIHRYINELYLLPYV